MPILQTEKMDVSYEIKYSKERKTIGISINKSDGLVISAPGDTSNSEIEAVLIRKERWILKKIDETGQILPPPDPKEFVSGERLQYIGRSYRLQVNHGEVNNIHFKFFQGKFQILIPQEKTIEDDGLLTKAVQWYKEKAFEKINERVQYYAPKIGKSPTSVRIREFKSRWGTCQEDKSVDFNWKIIIAPMSIIDYIIVHELCHLVSIKHSKEFWNKLSAIIVDHKKRAEWLRIHGALLTL